MAYPNPRPELLAKAKQTKAEMDSSLDFVTDHLEKIYQVLVKMEELHRQLSSDIEEVTGLTADDKNVRIKCYNILSDNSRLWSMTADIRRRLDSSYRGGPDDV